MASTQNRLGTEDGRSLILYNPTTTLFWGYLKVRDFPRPLEVFRGGISGYRGMKGFIVCTPPN